MSHWHFKKCFPQLWKFKKPIQLPDLASPGTRLVIPLAEIFNFFETSGHFYSPTNRVQILTQLKTPTGHRTSLIKGSAQFLTNLVAMGVTPIICSVSTAYLTREQKGKPGKTETPFHLPEAPTSEDIYKYLKSTVAFTESELQAAQKCLGLMGFPILECRGNEDACMARLANLSPNSILMSQNPSHLGLGVKRQLFFAGPLGPNFELVQLDELLSDLGLTLDEWKTVTTALRHIPKKEVEAEALCFKIRRVIGVHRQKPMDLLKVLADQTPQLNWQSIRERQATLESQTSLRYFKGAKCEEPEEFQREILKLIPDLSEEDKDFLMTQYKIFRALRDTPNHPSSDEYRKVKNELRAFNPLQSLPEEIPPVG